MSIDGFLRINNTTFAWNSSIVTIDGLGIEGVLSIDYEEKRESPVVHANRADGRPVAWAGGGKYIPPMIKIKMLKDTWGLLQVQLAVGGLIAPGLGSYGDAQFALGLQCVEPVIGSIPIMAMAAPCKIVGKRESRAEGTEALATEIDVSCLQLIENGIPLWSLVREAMGLA